MTVWISKSKNSSISEIDCEVDAGAGCNVIRYKQVKELYGQEWLDLDPPQQG